jgi:putative transposase
MSRPLRLDHAGAIWHVMARGNEQKDIYRDDADRERWLELLGRTASTCNWRVYAYAQMGNHFHLVIETAEATLSRGMQKLNGLYAQGFNRKHRRVGHLFQGRFYAKLVEEERYLLQLVRYVARNPVEAGLVRSAGDWAWSSHRATAGQAEAPPWLDVAWTLGHFGGLSRRYDDFVATVDPSFDARELHRRGLAFGSQDFRSRMAALAATYRVDREIPLAYRAPEPERVESLLPRLTDGFKVTREQLGMPRQRCSERALVAFGLQRYSRATGKVLAPLLGVSHWHAARLARRGSHAWAVLGLAGPPPPA